MPPHTSPAGILLFTTAPTATIRSFSVVTLGRIMILAPMKQLSSITIFQTLLYAYIALDF